MLFLHNLGRATALRARSLSVLLMFGIAAILAGMVGTGLLGAAAVMGMARLFGPIIALALVGAAFLLAAAAFWAVSHAWRAESGATQPQAAPKEAPDESEAAFAVGYVLGRFLIRKLTE